MFKKGFIILSVLILSIATTLAYTPSSALEKKLDVVVEKIEWMIDVKWEWYREKFLKVIRAYKVKYESSERASYILTYLYDELHEDNHSHDDDNSHNSNDVSESEYMWEYILDNSETGTKVTVTIEGDTRKMVSNALPNHETGEFPTKWNPNKISAQSKTYSFPLKPTYTGEAKWAKEPGIGVNGVKFEPETAERVECVSGEVYKIEAIQDLTNLGLDMQNAHVQPTGEYHYHWAAKWLIQHSDGWEDLVHVGFAKDGYMMYYSKSGKYSPSYELLTAKREWTSCTYRNAEVEVDNTTPDGTYVSDWKFNASKWDLDKCNGIEIDGEYSYIVTDEYPYIGRCLNGEFTEAKRWGGQWGRSGEQTGERKWPPPRR